MMRIAWIVCLGLIPQAEEDAAALLKAVQEKAHKAKSLRVTVTIAFLESGRPKLAFSGEVRAKGTNQWLMDFTTMKGDGLEQRFRGSCDGAEVGMRGFREQARKPWMPERYTLQLREWCATSFVPIFFSLAYGKIDQGDNNLPTVGDAKFLGREKMGDVDARVVQYLLSYPTDSKASIKAWINPVTLRPLKRELVGGPGGGIVETITSFEIDAETPDAVFVTPEPTEAERRIVRLTNKGIRLMGEIREAVELFNEKEGRYPTAAEGLEALVRKPKEAKNWAGPYVEEGGLPRDPWGNSYVYRFPGVRDPAGFDLSSPLFEDKYKLPLERMRELLEADDREAGVAAALKSILTAQFDFRSKHPDANGLAGFWVGDLSGLYRYLSAGAEIRLIDRRIAEADASPLKVKELSKDWPEKPVPYHGYLFSVFAKHVQDGKVKPYHTGGFRNPELLGVVAYPADYPKSGRYTLIIDGSLNILRRDLAGKTIDTCPSDDEIQKWRLPSGD